MSCLLAPNEYTHVQELVPRLYHGIMFAPMDGMRVIEKQFKCLVQ